MWGKSIEEKAVKWDAKYNFPRPINEQYLSSYKAFLRYSRDIGHILGYFVAMLLSFILILFIWLKLSNVASSSSPYLYVPCLIGVFLAVAAFLIDRSSVMLAYSGLFQRDSKGSAKWATERHLKDKNLLSKQTEKVVPKKIPIVPFGLDSTITIPTNFFAQHGIVMGPSGCGKTSTVFMNLARSFSKAGSLIALDISKDKAGEFYAYTAHYYDDAYRVDLMNSEFTDWFYLFEGCQGDSVQSGKVAAYIIGRDANKAEGGGDIWESAAELMLKCLILHICELSSDFPFPNPSDIFDFLAANPTDSVGDDGKPLNKLKEAMESSPNPNVQVEWTSIFSAVGDSSPRTYGSIVFTLMTKMGIFRDPKVQAILRPPTEEEIRAGRRKIEVSSLRQMASTNPLHTDGEKRGKAIYVVVAEGEASRLKTFIATFFGVAKDILKKSGEKPEDAYVLFALDEAGNVPLSGLSEDFGVGRGRKMIFFLGFQGISQLSKQYGNETARTIFENTGTYIIFPGAKDGTAEWVEKMLGKTTMLSRSASDAANNNYDSEKLSEEQRPLMFADEVRRMPKYTRCIVLFDDVDPILARVNDDAKTLDSRKCYPHQITFAPKKKGGIVRMPLKVQQPKPNSSPTGLVQMPESVIVADSLDNDEIQENNLLPMDSLLPMEVDAELENDVISLSTSTENDWEDIQELLDNDSDTQRHTPNLYEEADIEEADIEGDFS